MTLDHEFRRMFASGGPRFNLPYGKMKNKTKNKKKLCLNTFNQSTTIKMYKGFN